ncbi:hypothetical protein SEA_STIGMA_266 [Streptomyces phage Stigma]|nr:hypothetical protein SEA_STIGMA_1 [Streptomyces phage Stigma]UTN92490.1 hypothetical protein SEA_STIGMA_266 [Streptomyces phage Stigma]
MGCAIQYMERKGTNGGMNYGGYMVNDGVNNLVFVSCGTKGNTRPLFTYLGNGDYLKGKAVYEGIAFIMPDILLNAAQYNTLYASMDDSKTRSFKG